MSGTPKALNRKTAWLAGCLMLTCCRGPDQIAPFVADGRIALPHASGQMGHLTVDLARRHLFVAETGNGTVDMIDLENRKVIHRADGLKEPQDIIYVPWSDGVAVTSRGDGTLRLYSAEDLRPLWTLNLGDKVGRLGINADYLFAGHGDGALAIIDAAKGQKLKDIPLPGHPEGFRPTPLSVYVNVPATGQIVVADPYSGKLVTSWNADSLQLASPMALGAGPGPSSWAAVVSRSPARLTLYDLLTGEPGFATGTCRDVNDIFYDQTNARFYVSCGSGVVDAIDAGPGGLSSRVQIRIASGGSTSLFVPGLHTLFVAERAGLFGSNAAVAILKAPDVMH